MTFNFVILQEISMPGFGFFNSFSRPWEYCILLYFFPRFWHDSPRYCSNSRGLLISTVKKSSEPFKRAATILQLKIPPLAGNHSQVLGCEMSVAYTWALGCCEMHLLLRKAKAVIPDTPSSLTHRNDPSTASHSWQTEENKIGILIKLIDRYVLLIKVLSFSHLQFSTAAASGNEVTPQLHGPHWAVPVTIALRRELWW